MATTTIDRRALRVEEAAQALNISRARCYELVQSGELESFTLGRSRRIRPEAVEELIARRVTEAAAAR